MISLRPPVTKYKSLSEIGKFNMVWNVSLALIVIFSLLSLMHIYFGDKSVITSFSALLLATFNLIVLFKLRNYKIVGIISVIAAMILCQSVIFIIKDSHIISDTMWCLLVSIFSYFLFGSIAGTAVLIFNITGLIGFLMFGSTEDVHNKTITSPEEAYKMVINVYYVALALAFVMYKMVDNNRKISENYEKEIFRNEVLLKEIHHRVKNNLQIVSSLLRLQSAESENPYVMEHFNEAVSRIRSMSLIHEKMYQNDDLASVDIQNYLISLTQDVSDSFGSKCIIETKVQSDISKMNVNVLVPLSLIFNELITNSIKHGFSGQTKGEISVNIVQNSNNVSIVYHDSGIWKEAVVDESTFGVDLIETLINQLEGKYTLDISNGTKYSIEIDNLHFQ
ncbi:MAG: hypothetical protein RI883_332 [Bacteroidota bacterium]|jgi:two-component sensor histidine kinase